MCIFASHLQQTNSLTIKDGFPLDQLPLLYQYMVPIPLPNHEHAEHASMDSHSQQQTSMVLSYSMHLIPNTVEPHTSQINRYLHIIDH
jgi:hypothetical protein